MSRPFASYLRRYFVFAIDLKNCFSMFEKIICICDRTKKLLLNISLITEGIMILVHHKTVQNRYYAVIELKARTNTVKPLITNTSKEFIKCRILHFLIMECCRYCVFYLNDCMELFKNFSRILMAIYLFSQILKFT